MRFTKNQMQIQNTSRSDVWRKTYRLNKLFFVQIAVINYTGRD